jgi:predicted small lipoprotein YifL
VREPGRSPKPRARLLALIVGAGLAALGGCGQRGPLFLPEPGARNGAEADAGNGGGANAGPRESAGSGASDRDDDEEDERERDER